MTTMKRGRRRGGTTTEAPSTGGRWTVRRLGTLGGD